MLMNIIPNPRRMRRATRNLEVPQFSQVLSPLPDTPRGISETPMVRVPANASLLRAFQPRSSDSFHSVYSGLRPIYATQSHPQTLNPAHIQSLRDAKLRSGSGSPNARSCLENRERSFHLSRNENHHFTPCLQGCGRFHARKIGEPPSIFTVVDQRCPARPLDVLDIFLYNICRRFKE